MIPVLHFCAKDADLMVKNLEWWIHLDGKADFHAILSHDDATPARQVEAVKKLADQYFRSVEVFWYPQPLKKSWPAAPNWAWQNTARYVAATKNDSWFWIESDVVAIRRGWLKDIADEHSRAGKPFSGHIVDKMGHLNGSAVYPPNVALYSVDAFRTEESAWDVVLGKDLGRDGNVLQHVHPSHTLFQHCWCINPDDGKAWNGSGELATFKNTHDVVRLVDLTMAIFHRCKDGTLIDMLRLHYAHPELAMVPQHTETNEKETNKPVRGIRDGGGRDDAGGEHIQEADASTSDRHAIGICKEGAGGINSESDGSKTETIESHRAFEGICEILIVTYGLPTKRVSGLVVSDFDWLKWCLRCIRRHCTGFAGITVCFPNRDADRFAEISNEHAKAKSGIPLRIQMYTEREGKGHIQHMAQMAGADQLVPRATTHVLHVDADVMFKEPITPDEYFHGDKPVYVVRSWKSLSSPDGKVVSDCIQWKEPTDWQLGFDSDIYSMCRHPSGFPIEFYPAYREHIEKIHGKPFWAYMMDGEIKDGWRPNRMDFTAMGAFAWAKMHDRFDWVDISEGNHLAPRDKQQCYWSHSPITPEIQQDIEGFLK